MKEEKEEPQKSLLNPLNWTDYTGWKQLTIWGWAALLVLAFGTWHIGYVADVQAPLKKEMELHAKNMAELQTQERYGSKDALKKIVEEHDRHEAALKALGKEELEGQDIITYLYRGIMTFFR